MRRIAKIVVIIIIANLIFWPIYGLVPGVKAAVDTAVGPQVTGFFSAIGTSITTSPIWTGYITPWPNQLFLGLFFGLVFAWFIHIGFNRVRTVFVRSAERESGSVIMKEPRSTPPVPAPTRIEETEEKSEEK